MREVMGNRRIRPCEGDGCKKMVRRFRIDKKTEKHLCHNCYRKTLHIINSDTSACLTSSTPLEQHKKDKSILLEQDTSEAKK